MTQARGLLSVIHNIISVDGGTHFDWYKLTEMVVWCRFSEEQKGVGKSGCGRLCTIDRFIMLTIL